MKAYGGVDIKIHVFFNLAVVGGEWSASRSGRFGYPLYRRMGGPKNRSERRGEEENLALLGLELQLQPLGGPARGHSLYYCIQNVSWITSSLDSDADPYVIIRKLLVSIFSIWWEPKWPSRRSRWRNGLNLLNITYSRYGDLSKVL
jgi:hypothetical protein